MRWLETIENNQIAEEAKHQDKWRSRTKVVDHKKLGERQRRKKKEKTHNITKSI